MIEDSIAFQTSNQGRIVFRGSYPWPPFPPLPSAPDVDAPTPETILEDPPCGYLLTTEEFTGSRPDGTVERRLRLHGIKVDRATGLASGPGYVVRLTRPLRGLIPTLLDPQAAEPMVEGTRLYEFRPSPTAPPVCGRPG